MPTMQEQRDTMVDQQIVSRGVRDSAVLSAMRTVPREIFVEDRLLEFAYDDAPLPIEEGQTISQPLIVALMAESLELSANDRVLEIGAGSGYAAAVLSRIAGSVYAVERHETLAKLARQRASRLGYDNIEVLHGDGSLGWSEHAPYDAILVSAGGPDIPQSLLEQLTVGGRLVMPVGDEPRSQELLRVLRTAAHEYDQTSLGRVQFVPLIGSEGWSLDGTPLPSHRAREPLRITVPGRTHLSGLIAQACEPFDALDEAPLDPLLERIGDSRLVLIGEATHGTSEFYRMRARITQALVTQRGFNVLAIEGDWPDTSTIDQYVRGWKGETLRTPPFSRFPTWMWRNREMQAFIDWLAEHNGQQSRSNGQVSIHGLDLYSLYNSIGVVLDYLDRVDPDAARAARVRYGCFSPWEMDPATYGRAAATGRTEDCEKEVVATLNSLLEQRTPYRNQDGDSFFDAERNATVVRNAERYYRAMYRGSRESWNLRDQHMFDTLRAVLEHRGADAKAVVWAHNSHVGNAAATEMGVRGEFNIGQLAREELGRSVYSIGFGTHTGTVAAASNWEEPVQFMGVRPSHEDSYERLCHETGLPAFFLPLRGGDEHGLREALLSPHLERAIGVIYRPDTELLSHYFQAALPAQFDEFIWFDQSSALQPLEVREMAGFPDTYPFGL
ncbi:MAG: protein-L-isoaspartate(D-aspartate) O-methyltransferase [Deltaproteobacteria bacterium]|nr:protein-L-isoaspartate(D-aspartate) O-methyltransferase [Deltaproteobacteria bacterium]